MPFLSITWGFNTLLKMSIFIMPFQSVTAGNDIREQCPFQAQETLEIFICRMDLFRIVSYFAIYATLHVYAHITFSKYGD